MKYIFGLFAMLFVGVAYGADVPQIPTKNYVDQRVAKEVVDQIANNVGITVSQDNEIKTVEISGPLVLKEVVADDSNSNQVATTQWTNVKIENIENKVEESKGKIPVGSENADKYTQMWIEE